MGTGYTTDEKWSTRVVQCGSFDDGLPDPDALGVTCIRVVSEDGEHGDLYYTAGAWRAGHKRFAKVVDVATLECCCWYVPPSGGEIVDEMRSRRAE